MKKIIVVLCILFVISMFSGCIEDAPWEEDPEEKTITYVLDPTSDDGVKYYITKLGYNEVIIPSDYPSTPITQVMEETGFLKSGEFKPDIISMIWQYNSEKDSWNSWIERDDTLSFVPNGIYLILVLDYCNLTLTWSV